MSPAKPRLRDELRARRTGVRVPIELPRQLFKLVQEQQAKYGVTRKQIVVSALMRYFSAELPEVKELAKLGLQVLRRTAGESR